MASSGSHRLLLFVRGNTARSMQAITSVRAACKHHPGLEHALSVVDVFADPGLAERYRVIATPTLISVAPNNLERRWVGNVADVAESLTRDTVSALDGSKASEPTNEAEQASAGSGAPLVKDVTSRGGGASGE